LQTALASVALNVDVNGIGRDDVRLSETNFLLQEK
jgi:hypothetical protein